MEKQINMGDIESAAIVMYETLMEDVASELRDVKMDGIKYAKQIKEVLDCSLPCGEEVAKWNTIFGVFRLVAGDTLAHKVKLSWIIAKDLRVLIDYCVSIQHPEDKSGFAKSWEWIETFLYDEMVECNERTILRGYYAQSGWMR